VKMSRVDDLRTLVREVQDFPKPGIVFRDIMPVLNDARAFRILIEEMIQCVSDLKIDRIVGVESRGFILGAAMSILADRPFVPVRKAGKLPGRVLAVQYDLEYGKDRLEIQESSLLKGENILIVDDVLATGGTLRASVELVRKLEANVLASLVFVELQSLNGRAQLDQIDVRNLLTY
jgi:adenine phosphoribosyltransferase